MNNISYYKLSIGGVPISKELQRTITSLSVEESLTDSARLSLAFASSQNWSLTFDQIKLETKIELEIGRVDDHGLIFDGDIVDISVSSKPDGATQLILNIMDRSYRLKRVPIPSIYTSDKFDNLADICKSIVNKYGLKLILDPSGDIEKYKLADDQSIEQVNESDWEILYKIANTGRYRLFCRGDIVYLVKDDYLLSQQEKTLTMTLRSPDIKNGEIPILDLSLGVGLKDQRQSIQVISWNAVGEDSAELTEVELKDIKTSGATYTDIKVKTDIVETFRILGKVKDKKQARMYALAELQKRADNLVTGNVRIPGNRNIRIGNHYTINLNELGDIGSKFTGLYRIKKTTHTIDTQQGYITLAEFERSGLTK